MTQIPRASGRALPSPDAGQPAKPRERTLRAISRRREAGLRRGLSGAVDKRTPLRTGDLLDLPTSP